MTKVDRISSNLRERIHAGEWAGGQGLPSRGQFAEEYGVSSATITGAVRCLQREGLLRVIQGKGAFATNYEKNGAAPMLNTPIGLTGSYIPSVRELERVGMEGVFTRSIFDGIWKAANDENCPIVLLPSLAIQSSLTREYCRQTGVQGLIFLGGEGYANALALKQEGFPVILANKPLEPTPLNYVDYDNGWVVREVVNRFVADGRQRIAVVYSEGSVPAYFEGMKLQFLSALQAHRLLYPIEDYWVGIQREAHIGGRFRHVGKAVETLFALPEPPDAIFFWEPGMATPAMPLLEKRQKLEQTAILVSSYFSAEEVVFPGFVMPHCELGTALLQNLCATIRNPHHCIQLLLKPTFVEKRA